MVYINTLMLQQVLAQPHWSEKLIARHLSALTPLFWEHVNPYGRFESDMDARADRLINLAAGDTTVGSRPSRKDPLRFNFAGSGRAMARSMAR